MVLLGDALHHMKTTHLELNSRYNKTTARLDRCDSVTSTNKLPGIIIFFFFNNKRLQALTISTELIGRQAHLSSDRGRHTELNIFKVNNIDCGLS